ncbi:MAG: hypothetical protein JXR43_00700, partial [Burkholderiaceae bacterium]|nr:hypothetical protein [Burkholderiaceae bacterium]
MPKHTTSQIANPGFFRFAYTATGELAGIHPDDYPKYAKLCRKSGLKPLPEGVIDILVLDDKIWRRDTFPFAKGNSEQPNPARGPGVPEETTMRYKVNGSAEMT